MAAQKKKRNINLTRLLVTKRQNFFLKHIISTEFTVSLLISLAICAGYYYAVVILQETYISPLHNISYQSVISYFSDNQEQEIKEVIGFLPSWTVAQKEPIHIENLTQLIYFGLGVNDNGQLIQYDANGTPVLEWNYFISDNFTRIKKQAKKNNTKVLIAIKNFDNTSIDRLISNSVSTSFFIKQIKTLFKTHDIDGINLDFEYITDSDFPTAKYLNSFLKIVKKEIKKDFPNAIVSIDVNATAVLHDKAYEMEEIANHVDQIILMAYDYRRLDATIAGPIAPLYGGEHEHSIDESMHALLQEVSSEKVILGVPFYGYEWQTENSYAKSKTIPQTGALATYKRVTQLIEENDNTVVHWDNRAKSPWITYTENGATREIYFENARSIKEKITYAKDKKLSGIALWALGYEGNTKDLWDTIEKNK